VLDAGTIAMNLLSFRSKSFAFDHAAEVAGEPYSVFARTETESEAKLRPKLVHLLLAVPTAWLLYDEAADELVLGEDGEHAGPRSTGIALESAADTERFTEQGIEWLRSGLGPDRVLYVPAAHAASLLAPSVRDRIVSG
jgi:hypothetical protein